MELGRATEPPTEPSGRLQTAFDGAVRVFTVLQNLLSKNQNRLARYTVRH